MPRQARKNLDSNFILITQVSPFQIFRHNEDREYFLSLLKHAQNQYGCHVLAFCCAEDKGFKLILDTQGSNISKILQSITIAYALYRKSDVKLFEQRYKSKALKNPVEIQQKVKEMGLSFPEYAGCCYSNTETYEWLIPHEQITLLPIQTRDHHHDYSKLENWLLQNNTTYELMMADKSLRNKAIIDLRKLSNCSLKKLAIAFHLTESSISKILKKQ